MISTNYKSSDNVREGKDCDQCVFGVHYTSDGNLTRICAGKNVSPEEAIKAITSDGPCDMFDEGYKLYLKMKESGKGPCDFLCSIPANEMYVYDRRDYSKDPIGLCKSMSPCGRGDGKFCYCRLGCTSCMSIDNPNRMVDNIREDFLNAMRAAGISEDELNDF